MKKIFNLPNTLTITRLALIPVMVVLFLIDNLYLNYVLFVVYLIAVSTDKLDGYLARRKNLVTVFGAFLDPLVDKMLVHIFFILLAVRGILPVYLVIIIFARDLLINSIRNLAKSKGHILPCPWTSKLKALLQVIVVGFGLLLIAVSKHFDARSITINISSQVLIILMWGTVLFSLYAFYDFLTVKKHRDIIFD